MRSPWSDRCACHPLQRCLAYTLHCSIKSHTPVHKSQFQTQSCQTPLVRKHEYVCLSHYFRSVACKPSCSDSVVDVLFAIRFLSSTQSPQALSGGERIRIVGHSFVTTRQKLDSNGRAAFGGIFALSCNSRKSSPRVVLRQQVIDFGNLPDHLSVVCRLTADAQRHQLALPGS